MRRVLVRCLVWGMLAVVLVLAGELIYGCGFHDGMVECHRRILLEEQ